MYSHFSIILLCLSGVYCLSTTIDNLNWERLDDILNDRTNVEEWDVTMDQDILSKIPDGSTFSLNVRDTVEEFAEQVRADSNNLMRFDWIHDIIKTAYRCTLAKYASLGTFLVLQDIWHLKSMYNYTATKLPSDIRSSVVGALHSNSLFKEKFAKYSKNKYHLDFDVNVEGDSFQIFGHHVFRTRRSQETRRVLVEMFDKKLGLKIKYKTYPDLMKTNFRNLFDQRRIDLINKFLCVLNETVKVLDTFIVDKCVEHGGNFVRNFESLTGGFGYGDLRWLLGHLDELKERTAVKLYSDFTKPIPPMESPVKAAGCFIDDLEIEVAGFKMDLPNNVDPTTIYPENIVGRPSELKFKIVDSNDEFSLGVWLKSMVSFSDHETSSVDITMNQEENVAPDTNPM